MLIPNSPTTPIVMLLSPTVTAVPLVNEVVASSRSPVPVLCDTDPGTTWPSDEHVISVTAVIGTTLLLAMHTVPAAIVKDEKRIAWNVHDAGE